MPPVRWPITRNYRGSRLLYAETPKDAAASADTSFLSRAGYSVRASVSQRRRQIILKGLLDSGKYTKWEITEKISEFIKLRKNNPDMRDAIKRWEEDIAFVADYDTDNQTKVGRATFKQGGKITRR